MSCKSSQRQNVNKCVGLSPIELYWWTLTFKFHAVFMCHEIFFFWFVSTVLECKSCSYLMQHTETVSWPCLVDSSLPPHHGQFPALSISGCSLPLPWLLQAHYCSLCTNSTYLADAGKQIRWAPLPVITLLEIILKILFFFLSNPFYIHVREDNVFLKEPSSLPSCPHVYL